jgi:Tfp pilus assembly protein PilX
MFSVFGVLIFFISGGVTCTYSSTGAINPILAVILGVLAFFTAGAAACAYSNSRIAKQKINQTVPQASAEARGGN